MRFIWLSLLLALAGCNQYMCYDGTYVEDPYYCYSRGGLSYFYKARGENLSSYAGDWVVTLSRVSGNCPGVPARLTKVVPISQNQNRLSARAPGFGTLRGTLRNKKVRLSASQSFPCNASGYADVSFSSTSKGSVVASADVKCGQLYQCSATYSGSAIKK